MDDVLSCSDHSGSELLAQDNPDERNDRSPPPLINIRKCRAKRLSQKKKPTVSQGSKATKSNSKNKDCARATQSQSGLCEASTSNKSAKLDQAENVVDLNNLTESDVVKLREKLGICLPDHDYPGGYGYCGDFYEEPYGEGYFDPTFEIHDQLNQNGGDQPHNEQSEGLLLRQNLSDDIAGALFNESVNSGDVDSNDAFFWELPKLKTPQLGEPINPSLASLINTSCTSMCLTDIILKRCDIPEHCNFLTPPKVNTEVWNQVDKRVQTTDQRLKDIQDLVASGMVPIIKLAVLLKDFTKKDPVSKQCISDAITLLGQVQFHLSLRRRYLLRPHLKRRYANLCNLNTPISTLLLGDDIAKEVRKCDTAFNLRRAAYPFRGERGGRFRGNYNSTFNIYRGRGSYRVVPYHLNQRGRGRGRIAYSRPSSTQQSDKGKYDNDSIGDISSALYNWQCLTSDPWILQTVKGYEIEFESFPKQKYRPNEICFPEDQALIIDSEIEKLLSLGAIIPSVSEIGEFVSNIFIVPKHNGKYRPVINLKDLNSFIKYEHFKQETFNSVLNLIQRNDFFQSLDLCQAYFSVSINDNYQKFLKFTWRGKLFTFIKLPFGIASAPRVFTKLLKPVYAWFRYQGIRCSFYIDDSIILNQDESKCLENSKLMIKKLESLGYRINFDKSQLVPTQKIKYFGFVIDSVSFKVFLPEEKVLKIIYCSQTLMNQVYVRIPHLASFIGLVINACNAVTEGMLHYRSMERNKVQALLDSHDDYDASCKLSDLCRIDLLWWSTNILSKNGKPIRNNPIQYWLQTDASDLGWGASCLELKVSCNSRWSAEESGNHINFLELLSIYLALQSIFSNFL